MSELKCTKVVKTALDHEGNNLGLDNQGKQVYRHIRCGKPASECEVGGLLTKAKAVLCACHRKQADKESFVSDNGYQAGKISKLSLELGYVQKRLPGTGIVSE